MAQGHLMLEVAGSSASRVPGREEPVAIFTAFTFTECRGYLVSWMFVSGSQAGLDELKNTKIRFAGKL
jgi:hypothetical protein